MIFNDEKIMKKDIKIYDGTFNKKGYIMCGGITLLSLSAVVAAMRLNKEEESDADIIVNRIDFQRAPAWTRNDRTLALRSIDEGLDINLTHLWYSGSPTTKIQIIDGGNRLETMRSFMYNEGILMPSGTTEIARFRGALDNASSSWKDLGDTAEGQEKFNTYRLYALMYFTMEKDEYDLDRDHISLEHVVPIERDTTEYKECLDIISAQFIAYQRGKQNNDQENLRASRDTNGLLSRNIDEISRNFDPKYYGFKAKRAGVEEYIGRLAFALRSGPAFGDSKKKEMIELYQSGKEDNKENKDFMKEITSTIDNLKKTHKIYHEEQPNVNSSFTDGQCFTRSDGWLLTAFFFNEVFNSYAIKEKEDYVNLGNLPHTLFTAVEKWLKKVADNNSFVDLETPEKNTFEWIAFKWVEIIKVKKQYGSGSKPNIEKWSLLFKMMEVYDHGLKELQKRIQWPSYTYTILLSNALYKCQHTGETINRSNCEIHHKVPLHEGGTNEISNLMVVSKNGHAQVDPHRHLKAA